MKRVSHLFIGESFVAGDHPALGGASANNWIDGKITILKEDLTELLASDVSGGYDKPIYICRYDRVSGVRLSQPITKRLISSYKAKTYAAGTKKKLTVTIPVPVVGKEYGLFITDTSEKEVLYNGRRLFSYVAKTAVKGDLTDALVAQINGDKNVSVVASKDGSDNLALEAKVVPTNGAGFFEIGLTYELYGAVITTNAAGSFGCGTYAEVKKMEEDFDLGYQGHLNRVCYQDIPEKYAKSGSTYDIITLEHSQIQEDGMIGTTEFKSPVTTIIAVANGTSANNFKALLESYLDVEVDNLPS